MSLVSYLASGWSARLSPSLSPVTAIQTAISPTLSPSYNSQVMQNVSEDQDSRDPQHTRSQAAHFPQQRHSIWAQAAQANICKHFTFGAAESNVERMDDVAARVV